MNAARASMMLAMGGSSMRSNDCEHVSSELPDATYDACYCLRCGEWLEDRCNDLSCQYCKDRPAKRDLTLPEE
jgi:hypothetical protein